MSIDDLPTLADVQAERASKPNWKPKTRLEAYVDDEKPRTLIDEQAFKREVWTRDQYHCRCCGRQVIKTLSRVPERGEVHHCHGRGKDLRFESRAALLVCATCHERLTGRVNDRLAIIGSKFFAMHGIDYIDARSPVTFEKIA
jgi:hypothetical protein